jgi:hypothetical protein
MTKYQTLPGGGNDKDDHDFVHKLGERKVAQRTQTNRNLFHCLKEEPVSVNRLGEREMKKQKERKKERRNKEENEKNERKRRKKEKERK